MRPIVTLSVVALLALSACTAAGSSTPPPSLPPANPALAASEQVPGQPYRLVALGDSYTSGPAVNRRDSWPQQLVRAMQGDVRLRLVANLADVSITSGYVLREQLPQLESLRPDVVSFLVGANDVIHPDITPEMYRANVAGILDALLEDLAPNRIFPITTPDLTLTLHGGDYGEREANRRAIAEVNAILADEAAKRGVVVVDITPVSDRVPADATLVAADGLYPSAKQYAGWVEIIAPTMQRLLPGEQP